MKLDDVYTGLSGQFWITHGPYRGVTELIHATGDWVVRVWKVVHGGFKLPYDDTALNRVEAYGKLVAWFMDNVA